MCEEARKVDNGDVSKGIKTRDSNAQSGTEPSFNHSIINNNLNAETIINQFMEMIVKAQDLQASYFKFINVTSPNNLTKPGFPDITDVDDKTVWKKRTVLVTGNSILFSMRKSKCQNKGLLKFVIFPEQRT